MSQLPPTSPPYPPLQEYYAPPPLPGSIKSLSIVAIVLGSLFLLCDCMGLAGATLMLATGGKNPMVPSAPVVNQPGAQAFAAADSLIKLALAGWLLAGGIGGLRQARWARPAMLWWSVAALVWASASLMIQLTWTVPASVENATRIQSQTNAQLPQNFHGIVSASAILSVVIAWAFWCALPVCFLLLWRSPQVRAAFEQTRSEQPLQGGQPR
ncbi:MAG TPA: hypothetical protein VK797_07060 [Tepidisphaeraceae bacterium]|jgi:hypothetical protein|nr:hypothetical protein [Tepidisphaeraceae bacterium]